MLQDKTLHKRELCLQFGLADGDHGLPVVVDEERHVVQLGASLGH